MLRLLIPKPVVFHRLKQNLQRYFSWPVVNTGDFKVRLRPVSNAHNWMGTIIADIERMSTCPELKRWFANLLHVVVEVRYVNNSWSRRGAAVTWLSAGGNVKARAPGIPPSPGPRPPYLSHVTLLRQHSFFLCWRRPKTMLEFKFIRRLNYGGRFRIFYFNNRLDR